jgi:hypothetical protein
MDPNRDWAVHRLAAIAPPHAGISYLMGVKRRACVDETYSPSQYFVGPVVFGDRRGCHGRDGRAVRIKSQGNGAPA